MSKTMPQSGASSWLERPVFVSRVRELSARSDLIWAAALAVGIGFTLIAAYGDPNSASGKFWAYAGLFIRAALYLWAGEAFKGRGGETLAGLFRMGIVAGVFELLVDWGLIHWVSNGRLVYLTGNDVVLLASPVWMPLAWACVIVELGYPAIRVFGILGARMTPLKAEIASSLATALSAAVMVGFYEYFAFKANWWKYEPASAMIGDHCALYIPLGEFFMFLPLLPIAAKAISLEDQPVLSAIEGGVRFAVAIALGYALGYLLLEAGRAP